MEKINKNIEIVITTRENNLRSMALTTAQSIESILNRHFQHVCISVINDYSDLEQLTSRSPDLVFVGMKRVPLGDSYQSVFKYLEDNGINMTGSDSSAMALERDKTKAKDVVSAAGLDTSEYAMADVEQEYDASSLSLTFPIFIKPSNRGAGLGISDDSVVRNFDELNSGIKALHENGFIDILMENYLPGREFTVALLKKDQEAEYYISPIEITAPKNNRGDRILSGNTKHEDTEKVQMMQPEKLKDEIIDFAYRAFTALGARDFGRIDIRLDGNGVPYFIEANLIPGLLDRYFFGSLHLNEDLSHEDVIMSIVQLALKREI